MRDFAAAFYSSSAWKDCRKQYRASVGGLCERCWSKGILTPAVIVHHVVPLTPDNINDPTITLAHSNLQALCRDCHAIMHEAAPVRYKVDELGRVIVQADAPLS